MLVRKSKGFTMLDTIVSIAVISIAILTIITSESLALNIKNRQLEKDKGLVTIEAINKIMVNNLTYDEISSFFGNNVRYIKASNLNTDLIKKSSILNICSENKESQYPYVEIRGNKDPSDNVVKIEVKYEINEKEELKYVFYKGNY
ncbi:type II secretory pathway pseudopilin PulG [Clostridium punense]|uniref:Type II secretory pathway pseudopilin PulG n=2 Tax=Clostridium TaxID=1485 RepID=A0ABS4K1T9_9CLOT|nr:type II secretion system protein [Clostridium punense]MBP2021743.1 type II secretory pathway pseudopilin PulG [Clostridium punense]